MTAQETEATIVQIMELDHEALVREILEVNLPWWRFTREHLDGLPDESLKHMLFRAREMEAEKAAVES
jgi:hypothetical protein